MTDFTKDIRYKKTKREARLCADNLPGSRPLCIAWQGSDRNWISTTFTREQAERIFENVPERREEWINKNRGFCCIEYSTRDEADENAAPDRIGLIHLVYEGDDCVLCEYIRVDQ